MYNISVIGSGNVAYRFALALKLSGNEIISICCRNAEKGDKIIRGLKRYKSNNTLLVNSYNDIPNSDIIIIAVADSAIEEVISQLSGKRELILHTSGATPSTLFNKYKVLNYGVLYPLMTLSKNREIDIRMVPFLIEANSNDNLDILKNIVVGLKAEYKVCDSVKRLQMHCAAVYSTNFINYLLTLCYDISNPDFTFFLPAALESIRKAFLTSPYKSQTGPALRGDINTITRHQEYLKSLDNEEFLEVYNFLTSKISNKQF